MFKSVAMIESQGKQENDDSQSLRKKIYTWEKKAAKAKLRDTLLSNLNSGVSRSRRESAKGSFVENTKRFGAGSRSPRSSRPVSTPRGKENNQNSSGSFGDLKDEIEKEEKKGLPIDPADSSMENS